MRNPNDLPAAIKRATAEKLVLEITIKELASYLDDGTTYKYCTFGGTVPEPLLRLRVGDTVEQHLKHDR